MTKTKQANSSFEFAYERGKKAALDGKSEHDNPYPDLRTLQGGTTWSRAYRRRWSDGFRRTRKAMEEQADVHE